MKLALMSSMQDSVGIVCVFSIVIVGAVDSVGIVWFNNIFVNLRKSADELFLFCCWCDGSAHFKCAGFKGTQFDYINFSTCGLRWTCHDCRDMDVNVFKKLTMIEENFSKYKYLEQPELLPHNVRGSPASSIVSVDLTTEKLSTDCAVTLCANVGLGDLGQS
uniref:Uncharacterized protein n=1 Tax=Glossina austeni TaxID=7395 RepID=A0A1A9VAI7_GLOAU